MLIHICLLNTQIKQKRQKNENKSNTAINASPLLCFKVCCDTERQNAIVSDVGKTLLHFCWLQPTTVRRRGLINVTDADEAVYIARARRAQQVRRGRGRGEVGGSCQFSSIAIKSRLTVACHKLQPKAVCNSLTSYCMFLLCFVFGALAWKSKHYHSSPFCAHCCMCSIAKFKSRSSQVQV